MSEWKPKQGERVSVWNNGEKNKWSLPFVCEYINDTGEKKFIVQEAHNHFRAMDNIEQIQVEPPQITLGSVKENK